MTTLKQIITDGSRGAVSLTDTIAAIEAMTGVSDSPTADLFVATVEQHWSNTSVFDRRALLKKFVIAEIANAY